MQAAELLGVYRFAGRVGMYHGKEVTNAVGAGCAQYRKIVINEKSAIPRERLNGLQMGPESCALLWITQRMGTHNTIKHWLQAGLVHLKVDAGGVSIGDQYHPPGIGMQRREEITGARADLNKMA